MAHPLFGPEVQLMLAERNVRRACASSASRCTRRRWPRRSTSEFTPEQIWEVISQANIRTQASIFEYLPPALQVEMAEKARPQMGQLLTKMSHDDRVDLLRRLPARVAESVMRLVDEADRKDIATLFSYGENTVGALMTTDYAWLPATVTAAEAIDQLRAAGAGPRDDLLHLRARRRDPPARRLASPRGGCSASSRSAT